MALPNRETTKQGFEKQFGVNHIGHFLLTKNLLENIKTSKEGRIINVSSLAHTGGLKRMRFEDINHETSYVPWTAYSQSKLSNVLFTEQLAKNLEEDGVTNVTTVSLHPGVVRTELGRYMFDGKPFAKLLTLLMFPVFWLCTKTPLQGSQTSLHCCLAPVESLKNGKYYADCKIKQATLCDKWEAEAQKLWEFSEEAVKDYAL